MSAKNTFFAELVRLPSSPRPFAITETEGRVIWYRMACRVASFQVQVCSSGLVNMTSRSTCTVEAAIIGRPLREAKLDGDSR